MALFDIYRMQWGSADIDLVNVTAGTSSTRDGSADLTDGNDAFADTFKVSALAGKAIWYGVLIPAVQDDGSTATTESDLTVKFEYLNDAGTQLGPDIDWVVANPATPGVRDFIALHPPYGATQIRVTLTVEAGGNLGVVTAGFCAGPNYLSVAG
jgi:hypothetical protein